MVSSESDEDSSGEGRISKGSKGSKGSSKSKKSRRRAKNDNAENVNDTENKSASSVKSKKKKSKRRTSNALSEASETDKSDVEDGSSKRSLRKSKGSSSNDNSSSQPPQSSKTTFNADTVMKESMLVKIKNKRNEKQMNGAAQNGMSRRGVSKGISFSGSTIVRDAERQKQIVSDSSALDIAMGKLPQSALDSSLGSDNGNSNIEVDLMEAMGKIHSTSESNDLGDNASKSSALKPGRYAPKKKKANFAGDLGADEPPDTSRAGRKKLNFRQVDYGSEDDSDTGRPRPRRSSSTNSMNSSLKDFSFNGGSRDFTRRHTDDHLSGSRQPSFKPQSIGPRGKSKLGTSKTGSLDSDEGLRSSLTLGQRPGIQRRNTMGSITTGSARRASKDMFNDSGGIGDGSSSSGVDRRSTLHRAAQSMAINQHKQIRRLEMSEDHQTYIPPKSRNSGVLQAMTHIISGSVVDLTLWTYKASTFKVMLFFLAFYIINIFVWAAVLDAVDLASGGQCIHEDPEGMSRNERYEFVFELSWATFTTVGYGTISPQGDMTGCYAIRFTCAFVAFIGVLFASQTAAIMYSKLMRLLAKAHVTFSSTLCVQYGKGNEGSTVRFGQLNFRASVAPAALLKFSASDLLDDSTKDNTPSGSEDGFPVIEFRMINDRANHEGSEIWDAQISGIVQLKKEQSSDTVNSSFAKDKGVGGESTLDLEKKVYYPITLSPNTHPHFSRIWYARHTLNAESPLLKREYRDMIVKDGGKWDKEFNNWEEIREALNPFLSLRITLSGTSAVSASAVYGDHVYEFDDVCVGWRFANMVYETKERTYHSCSRRLGFGRATKEDKIENHDNTADMRTKIDAALLHDIVPQPGGNFEPLNETTNTQGGRLMLKFFTLGIYGD